MKLNHRSTYFVIILLGTTVMITSWYYLSRTAPCKGKRLKRTMNTSVLREYGFDICPWMSLPENMRYPRKIDLSTDRPSTTFLCCLDRLIEWQERKKILFVLAEGHGLGAQMTGGYHGNSDDDDIDIRGLFHLDTTQSEPENWCDTYDMELGVYGKFSVGKQTETFVKNNARNLTNYCIGEFESRVVLLTHPKTNYSRELYGGSFWVPPVQGGKDLGRPFLAFFDPKKSRSRRWFSWFEKSHDGIRTLDKSPSDGKISKEEFFDYLTTNSRINQEWLQHVRVHRPCFVANALVHYQHIMRFGNMGRSLRYRCGNKYNRYNWETREACTQQNWKLFKMYYHKPEYFEDEGMHGRSEEESKDKDLCLKFIN